MNARKHKHMGRHWHLKFERHRLDSYGAQVAGECFGSLGLACTAKRTLGNLHNNLPCPWGPPVVIKYPPRCAGNRMEITAQKSAMRQKGTPLTGTSASYGDPSHCGTLAIRQHGLRCVADL